VPFSRNNSKELQRVDSKMVKDDFKIIISFLFLIRDTLCRKVCTTVQLMSGLDDKSFLPVIHRVLELHGMTQILAGLIQRCHEVTEVSHQNVGVLS